MNTYIQTCAKGHHPIKVIGWIQAIVEKTLHFYKNKSICECGHLWRKASYLLPRVWPLFTGINVIFTSINLVKCYIMWRFNIYIASVVVSGNITGKPGSQVIGTLLHQRIIKETSITLKAGFEGNLMHELLVCWFAIILPRNVIHVQSQLMQKHLKAMFFSVSEKFIDSFFIGIWIYCVVTPHAFSTKRMSWTCTSLEFDWLDDFKCIQIIQLPQKLCRTSYHGHYEKIRVCGLLGEKKVLKVSGSTFPMKQFIDLLILVTTAIGISFFTLIHFYFYEICLSFLLSLWLQDSSQCIRTRMYAD